MGTASGTSLGGVMAMLMASSRPQRMKRQKPDLLQFTVANQGHAPLLHETVCQDEIARFLTRLP